MQRAVHKGKAIAVTHGGGGEVAIFAKFHIRRKKRQASRGKSADSSGRKRKARGAKVPAKARKTHEILT